MSTSAVVAGSGAVSGRVANASAIAMPAVMLMPSLRAAEWRMVDGSENAAGDRAGRRMSPRIADAGARLADTGMLGAAALMERQCWRVITGREAGCEDRVRPLACAAFVRAGPLRGMRNPRSTQFR